MKQDTKTKTDGQPKGGTGKEDRKVRVEILSPREGQPPGVSIDGMTHYAGSDASCTEEEATKLVKEGRAVRLPTAQ